MNCPLEQIINTFPSFDDSFVILVGISVYATLTRPIFDREVILSAW